MSSGNRVDVEWREWSLDAFDEAKSEGKLILLGLSASWCHWCHVMDSSTYSDPEVARTVNEHFVPVRVDIDRRPDISERYNRGGFPTTAFLSDKGETVWGATYLPPAEMKRVMAAILDAKSSGSIDEALERERAKCQQEHAHRATKSRFSSEDSRDLFEEILSRYDIEHGGLGTEPKFPNPDFIELLLIKFSEDGDLSAAEAARTTLLKMAGGLYDPVEGGVFRYSVSRDWKVPHYEKMLETNAGYLLNLAHARLVLVDERFSELAEGVAKYMLNVLRNPSTGGFFGSQDADESYYKLSRSGRTETDSPSIDTTVYAGWNLEAAAALSEAGKLLGRSDWVAAAEAAVDYAVSRLWDSEAGLVRHTERQELYLFEDQVSMLRAVVSVLEHRGDSRLRKMADALVESVRQKFPHPDGGYRDVLRTQDSIGELDTPLRSLIWNSKWAHALALYELATDRPESADAAMATIESFGPEEIRAHGIFATSFLIAWKALSAGPVKVEVWERDGASTKHGLWLGAKQLLLPNAVVLLKQHQMQSSDDRPFATVCGRSGCSHKIYDVESLREALSGVRTSQA